MPPNTVKVDRTTRWGNPFRVGARGVESDVEALVTFQLMLRMHGGFWPHDRGRFAGSPFIGRAEIASNLAGKNLACWCKLGEPCHADVLLELANAEAGR